MPIDRILKDEASEEKGERALMSSFVGAKAISDLVKTALAPKGMDKILQTTGRGHAVTIVSLPMSNYPINIFPPNFRCGTWIDIPTVTVTNDGATILKSLHIDNPAAKVLIDISKVQDDEVGDGTTSVVVLAGELLREAEELVASKIHSMTIIAGYRMAAECGRDALLKRVIDNKENPGFHAMATKSNQEGFKGGFTKLLKEQWEIDILLKAGESDDECAPIAAHKIVLASRSEVFKKMLESDKFKASAKLETITLSDMKHEELEALIEFMYNVDGSISNETLKKYVQSLYVAADKYEIPHLRDLCRNHLISSLDLSNALIELAQIPLDKILNDCALAIIKLSIRGIAQTADSAEFKDFVINHPDLILEILKNPIQSSHCYTCGKK